MDMIAFNNDILHKVALVNRVFEKLKLSRLFENKDFQIDEMSSEFYLKLNFVKADYFRIEFIISSYDIQINVDRINEAFVWSNKQIETSQEEIVNLIEMILTKTIKFEYCGSNFTKLYIINDNGECLKTLKNVRGLYFKTKCQIKEYKPIYNWRQKRGQATF